MGILRFITIVIYQQKPPKINSKYKAMLAKVYSHLLGNKGNKMNLINGFSRNFFKIKYGSGIKKSMQQESYFESRLKVYNKHQYPHIKPSISISAFIQKYSHLKHQSTPPSSPPPQKQQIIGRISSIRQHGKTTFLDIREQHKKLQVAIKSDKQVQIRRGDVIAVNGNAFVTKKGELSIHCQNINDLILLAPCLWMLPEYQGLKDCQARFRNKSLDLMVNSGSMEAVKKRAKIISVLRRELENDGFTQVQTPILSPSCGGAIAKPFTTYHNDHKSNLYLRIAPQLYLKKLLIGGLLKVFQIGKNFRNESIDQTHNPQFTSCQLYSAYEDYKSMIKFTHKLINKIAKQVNGNTKIKVKNNKGQIIQIQLNCQWKQIDFMSGLQSALGLKLPIDFQNQQTVRFYQDVCVRNGVNVEEPRCIQRLLDKLAGRYLETTYQPFIIMNHPKVMSPLAKPHPDKPYLTQRFQLFINGWQVVNSYTQLNDPRTQKQNTPNDLDFVKALEYGLMPCAGWGIGLDRLIMILTGQQRIQQVIAFPLLRQMLNDKDQNQSFQQQPQKK